MNTAQIVEAVRKDTPKAASPTIRIVLQVLADERWFEVINKVEGQKGRVRKFRFLGEPTKKSRKKPVAQAVDEKLDALTDGGFIETAVATLRNEGDQGRVERYKQLFEELTTDLGELDALKGQLAEAHANLAKERAIRADVEKNLDTVIRERDELQGKLDTLKQIFQ
jgi:DNA repair exonuclease SbcCD ATPase subunit